MNPQSRDPITRGGPDGSVSDAEVTLRLIAALPPPVSLEDRIHTTLQTALTSAPPQAHGAGRVLAWRAQQGSGNGWMRSAAAAAIAFVVVGGGWGVYSRVQPLVPGRVAAPARVAAPGAFGGAGAIRTPQTLNGPVLTHPAETKKAAKKHAAARKAAPQSTVQATPPAKK
jgi:hypothetical protein